MIFFSLTDSEEIRFLRYKIHFTILTKTETRGRMGSKINRPEDHELSNFQFSLILKGITRLNTILKDLTLTIISIFLVLL